MGMNEEFGSWLSGLLDARGWSRRELARRIGVSHTTIVNVAAGETTPSAGLCRALARELNEPPEMVFRRAGLLPSKSPPSESLQEASHLFSLLAEEEQEILLTQMRALVERRRRGLEADRQSS
jgi:transcriptional regulator with XRE-family HTH domain